MKPSQFNFMVNLDNEKIALVNTLTGALDVFSNEEIKYLNKNFEKMKDETRKYLYERQYLIDDIDEENLIKRLFEELVNYKRDYTPIKCVIILTFDCNLKCIYCWQQHNLGQSHKVKMTKEKIDKIFESIEKIGCSIDHKDRGTPVIQLFGGEPLLYKNREIVEYILDKCSQRAWHSQITTNGVELQKFLYLFEKYDIGEIQITVDGPGEIQESRRVGSNYQKIMDSIDTLLQLNKTNVKVRVNVDFANIESIHLLANEIIDRKWYTNRKFYGYLAPLRDSSCDHTVLIKERSNLLKKLFEQRKIYPQLELFDLIGWDGYEVVKILENTGRMPLPKANICDANMNQFVFTPNGEIHVCAEVAHDSEGSVGRYWPQFTINQELFAGWYNKTPFDFEGCSSCPMLPHCCGGCQLFEKNRDFKREFCKAVKESFSLSVKNYLTMEGTM